MERIPAQALAALEQGNLFDAIKHVRESTGLGLKESKELVEAHLASDIHLQERYRSARPTTNLFSFVLIAALIMLAWLIYRHVIGGR